MRKYLSVEVEHTRQARFLQLDQPGENKISLTTLADFQKRAEVKIFLIHEGQRILLHTFEVQRLPKKQAGEPRLVLKGTYDGKGNVRLSISVDGRHYSSTSISIKKYTRERVWWPWVLLLALFLLGTSAWLLLRGCTATEALSSPAGPSPTATSSADRSSESVPEPDTQSQTQPQNQTQNQSQASDTEPAVSAAGDQSQASEQQQAAAAGDQSQASEQERAAEPEQATEIEQPAGTSTDQEQTDRTEADRPAVDLSHKVYFGPDSSELSPEARRALSRFVEELQDYDQLKLRIEGHCALYGTEQGREELSYDRAQRVVQYFRELGYRFDEEPVILGRGGDEPVSRNNDEQHLNRRVEISIIQPE